MTTPTLPPDNTHARHVSLLADYSKIEARIASIQRLGGTGKTLSLYDRGMPVLPYATSLTGRTTPPEPPPPQRYPRTLAMYMAETLGTETPDRSVAKMQRLAGQYQAGPAAFLRMSLLSALPSRLNQLRPLIYAIRRALMDSRR